MLPIYQLKITAFYQIPIGTVKKMLPNFFNKEKYLLHYENLQIYLRLGLIHCVLEFNQSHISNLTQKNRAGKKW